MTRMSPAEQAELDAAIDAEFALAAEPTGYRLGEAARVRDLTVNQRLAAEELADTCGWCARTDCDDRWEHDRLVAGSETTWWRRWAS